MIRAKRELGCPFLPPALSLFQTVVLTMPGPIHHKNSDYPPSLLELSLSSLNTPFSHCPCGKDFFLLFVSGDIKLLLITLTLLRPLHAAPSSHLFSWTHWVSFCFMLGPWLIQAIREGQNRTVCKLQLRGWPGIPMVTSKKEIKHMKKSLVIFPKQKISDWFRGTKIARFLPGSCGILVL